MTRLLASPRVNHPSETARRKPDVPPSFSHANAIYNLYWEVVYYKKQVTKYNPYSWGEEFVSIFWGKEYQRIEDIFGSHHDSRIYPYPLIIPVNILRITLGVLNNRPPPRRRPLAYPFDCENRNWLVIYSAYPWYLQFFFPSEQYFLNNI